jgi:hypothetical protein
MRCRSFIIGAWVTMNIVPGAGCADGDEEEGVGAAVAERAERPAEEAARASPGEAEGEPAFGPEEIAAEREGVAGPPGKCCYVRCGAQLRYHKIPWEVQGSCDAEGWNFCEQFYVAKLADAAWLRC